MEMLDIPLRLENGQLARIPSPDAYKKYIDFFFTTRKYETPAFGVDTDDFHWLPPSEYLRVLVKEFNETHHGWMNLHVDGQTMIEGQMLAALQLRVARERIPVSIDLAKLTNG